MNSLFIINHGSIVVAPHKKGPEYTMTVHLGDTYCKLRNLLVSTALELSDRKGDRVFIESPISVGSGRVTVLLDRTKLHKAVASIRDGSFRDRVMVALRTHLTESAIVESIAVPLLYPCESTDQPVVAGPVSIPPRVFYGVLPESMRHDLRTTDDEDSFLQGLRCKSYSFSCIMGLDHRLEIMAVRSISETEAKKVQEMRSIWSRRESDSGLYFPVAVKAKGSATTIGKEVSFARGLSARGVPHIASMELLPPNCSSAEAYRIVHSFIAGDRSKSENIMELLRGNRFRGMSLIMEYAPYGDFAYYSRKHYDEATGHVLPYFRETHLLCAYYLAEALCGMHGLKAVYGDVKAQNLLVVSENPLSVRLTDFGLSGDIGSKKLLAPGTYPPPELVALYQQQLIEACFQADVLRRDEAAKGTHPDDVGKMVLGLIDHYGVELTPEVDAWAFGVLLLKLMYSDRVPPFKTLFSLFDFNSSRDQIEYARDLVLARLLDRRDPVDGIIAQLLDRVRGERISMEDAKHSLGRLLGK